MIAYVDAFSGCSGDMLLGALLDAGLELGELRRVVGALPVSGDRIEALARRGEGPAGTQARVVLEPDSQPERSLSDVLALVERAGLEPQVAATARPRRGGSAWYPGGAGPLPRGGRGRRAGRRRRRGLGAAGAGRRPLLRLPAADGRRPGPDAPRNAAGAGPGDAGAAGGGRRAAAASIGRGGAGDAHRGGPPRGAGHVLPAPAAPVSGRHRLWQPCAALAEPAAYLARRAGGGARQPRAGGAGRDERG